MSGANEFKYSVIQFSEVPYKDVADYVCVPRSWVHARGPYDPKVKVSYPVENPLETEKRVKKRQKKSDEWNSYLSVIKYNTDDYDEAKRYIQRMIPALQNEDKTLSSFEENPRRFMRKNKNKSANTTSLERNAVPDLDEEPHNKRSKVSEPDDSDDQMVPASQVFEVIREDQSLIHEVSNQDQRTQETPIDESKDGDVSENVPTINQNPADGTQYLFLEKVANHDLSGDFFKCVLQELLTNLQVYTASLVTDAVTKIINNSNTAWRYDFSVPFLPKTTPQEAPTLNERKNEELTKKEDIDDDDEDQPLKKISSPKIIKKVLLPAEYDENDSTWTLKYRKPGPGLVELMEDSGVYVKALELKKCKRLSKDCKSLARMLLIEIFTRSALGTCSLTGARAKAFDKDGTKTRPGLDEHARTVLMNYVAEHAIKVGWYFENQTILSSIRNKMQELKVKYKSKLSKSKRISKQK